MTGRARLGLWFVVAVAVLGAFTAPRGAVDVYVVLVLVALLVLREMLASEVPLAVRGRIDVFLFLGFLAFAAIVVARVRAALGL